MLKKISLFLILIGLTLLTLTYGQVVYLEARYRLDKILGYNYRLETQPIEVIDNNQKEAAVKDISIKPINKDFSIVIEVLNVNAPIIKDVPIIDKNSYLESLKNGVAHASFSDYPSTDQGKVYLFAHSSYNFWELGKYSSVFNQLNKLKFGDEINIFYENKRYVYRVDNLEFINDFKVDETSFDSLGNVLTLQTCHPPGTTLYRLVVKSSLVKVE